MNVLRVLVQEIAISLDISNRKNVGRNSIAQLVNVGMDC
jgi:hypothetical protein